MTIRLGKLPGIGRDRLAEVGFVFTRRECGGAGVQRHRLITGGIIIATEREARHPRFFGDELRPHYPRHGTAIFLRRGDLNRQPSLPRQDVTLPSRRHDGITSSHKKAITGVSHRARRIALLGVVEELDGANISPVIQPITGAQRDM